MAKNLSANILVAGNSISFGERLAASGAFDALFREGMALVEDTAAYLDGEGRDEARDLPRIAALAYASESMRLTTRLMQIASWLLLQRAVNEGEMTQAEASDDKTRARTAWQIAPKAREGDGLPPSLLSLIEKSVALQARLARLDGMMIEPEQADVAPMPNPLDAQMALLRDAFLN